MKHFGPRGTSLSKALLNSFQKQTSQFSAVFPLPKTENWFPPITRNESKRSQTSPGVSWNPLLLHTWSYHLQEKICHVCLCKTRALLNSTRGAILSFLWSVGGILGLLHSCLRVTFYYRLFYRSRNRNFVITVIYWGFSVMFNIIFQTIQNITT